MDVLNELAAKAMSGLEMESLVSFMRSFCGNLARTGDEIPERDKPMQEAFQKVYEAALAVEEKTRELAETDKNLSADDKEDAMKRLGELRSSVDRLQTLALRNPPLASFTKKVALQANAMSRTLEEFLELEEKK